MKSNENSTISTDLLTPSVEALALLRLDYLQSLHNKLIYARPTETERDFLLQEICRIEDEQTILGHLNPQEMYKPEPKTLETLQAEKAEVMNKIVNGTHLDAVAIGHLQNQLKDLNQQIEDVKKEEVSSGQ